MKTRAALAVVVYLLAVSIPALGLYAVFGLETKVDLGSVGQVAALAATAVFTFGLGTFGGVLLRKSDKPPWLEVLEALSRESTAKPSTGQPQTTDR